MTNALPMTIPEPTEAETLIAWLRKRAEPDSGIRYQSNGHGGIPHVELTGSDATFVKDNFHGKGARDLADALDSLLAASKARGIGEGVASPDDFRRIGYSVAVHNDYRLDGEAHTFWLLTHPEGHWLKGEGRTDAEALDAIRSSLNLVRVPLASPSPDKGGDVSTGAPEGYVLVPREPTPEMLGAGGVEMFKCDMGAVEPRVATDRIYRAMLSAAPIAPGGGEEEGWLDIVTAPRDGTHVIVSFDGTASPPTVAHWFGPPDFPGLRGGGWYLSVQQFEGPQINPTHWRPLPPPPVSVTKP